MIEQSDEVRRCGRPTKAGKPCRVQLSPFDVACGTHATEQNRAVAEAHRRGNSEGFRQGWEMGSSSAKSTIERLEQRVRELEQRLDDAQRYFDMDGDQVVEVDGYAYRWSGSRPLAVGDRVVLPQNWLSSMRNGPGTFEGVVTKIGATYRGELSRIVRRA
ncbi:hypothetical protein [Micromonospora sp. NPDC050276]|uniref:hypothetical protein n=1 Tax=Micromonospora sp. NPDC050276 TaxID=3364278 RepID=UPI00378B95F3